jgi:Fe-Mn family superoxide dismutase
MFIKNLLKFKFTSFSKYELPKLEYAYDALEPVISKQQLELHHGKHHKTYVDNLNAQLEKIPHAVNDPQ